MATNKLDTLTIYSKKLLIHLKELINTGKKLNVNFQDENGMNSLHQASITGNLEIIKLLIENGAKIDLKDNKGTRALHFAAYNGKTDIVVLLLRCGANCNEPTFSGDTPLHLAAQMGYADVVFQLLAFGADVTLMNANYLTSLDLACEFGRTKCVEVFLQNRLCIHLLKDKSKDLLDAQLSTTCLHLAARNNHTDIIRLLLLYGIDVNRFTYQGTALHEACRYGRYQSAKLLLECGIDINQKSFQNQLASDVIIKQKVGNDIKRIIKEFSEAVYGVSIQAYLENHAGSLNFQKDEYITVLERNPSGNWRGFILQNDFSTRFGYFPSVYIRLIDRISSRPNGTTTMTSNAISTAGKQSILSPKHSIMMDACANAAITALNSGKISRFSSTASTSITQIQVPKMAYYNKKLESNPVLANIDEITCDVSPIGSIDSSSKLSLQSSNAADSGISSHKSLNQSPPQSSSSSSLANATLENNTIYETTSQIYSKTLSSTLRSFPNSKVVLPTDNSLLTNEEIYSPSKTLSPSSTSSAYFNTAVENPLSVSELIRSGLNDSEIILNWLNEIKLQNYYENFVNAGYDLLTLMKMTPSDLIAIGISDPHSRKLILHHTKRLNINDLDDKLNQLLKNITTLKSLLELIHLEQYLKQIMQQGYLDINDLLLINCEDLEDIGINKLGHQKKFMLTIKRLQQLNNERPNNETKYSSNLNSSQNNNPPNNNSFNNNNSNSISNVNGQIHHAKSCENVAILSNSLNEPLYSSTKPKPVPPQRTDSIIRVNENMILDKFIQNNVGATTSCYATLPRKRNVAVNNQEQIKCKQQQQLLLNKEKLQQLKGMLNNEEDRNTIKMPFANDNYGTIKYKTIDSTNKDTRTIPQMTPFYHSNNANKLIHPKLIHNQKNDHVLNDIDSMLSDLNKQLDAMLEHEKSFKNC